MRYKRISALLLFAFAVLQSGTPKHIDVMMGNCNDVIRLPCNATAHTKTYRYIVWYKIGEIKNTAIIKKKGTEVSFNLSNVSLGENETLVLHNIQPADSGRYKCYLAAAVGGQNHESNIGLNITECDLESTVYPTTIIPSEPCPAVKDLSFTWAAIGFFLISVAKIFFCIITVAVCNQIIFKTRKIQKQEVSGSMNGTLSSCENHEENHQKMMI